MELAAGGVERVLLLFGDVRPEQWAAVVVDEAQQDGRCRLPPQCRLVVAATNDLAAEHPQVIAMATQGGGGQSLAEQVQQKD